MPGPRAAARGGPPSTDSRSDPRASHAGNPADVQLMALLRRLTAIASRPGEFDAAPRSPSGGGSHSAPGRHSDVGAFASTPAEALGGPAYAGDGLTGLMAVNVARRRRQ